MKNIHMLRICWLAELEHAWWHSDILMRNTNDTKSTQHTHTHANKGRKKRTRAKYFQTKTHQINFNLNLLLLGIQLSLVVLLFVHCFVLHPLVSIFVCPRFLDAHCSVWYLVACSGSGSVVTYKQSVGVWLDSVLLLNGCYCFCGCWAISPFFIRPFWRRGGYSFPLDL